MFNNGNIVIDTLGNGNFIMIDDKYNSEDIISSYEAHRQYDLGDVKFTKKAIDEIQNTIEDEFLRQEESCQASYAPSCY